MGHVRGTRGRYCRDLRIRWATHHSRSLYCLSLLPPFTLLERPPLGRVWHLVNAAAVGRGRDVLCQHQNGGGSRPKFSSFDSADGFYPLLGVVIPFRFIDGIMGTCQRYTTHG